MGLMRIARVWIPVGDELTPPFQRVRPISSTRLFTEGLHVRCESLGAGRGGVA
jgi:hypothetical protein